MSGRVFPEISIWFSRRSGLPAPLGWASPNPWKPWIEQKEEGRPLPFRLMLSWDRGLPLPSDDENSPGGQFRVPRPQARVERNTPSFPGLQASTVT